MMSTLYIEECNQSQKTNYFKVLPSFLVHSTNIVHRLQGSSQNKVAVQIKIPAFRGLEHNHFVFH